VSFGQPIGSANGQQPGRPPDRATASSRDGYRYWLDSVTEPRHYSGGHLSALAADELLFEARNRYFAEAVPLPAIASSLWLVYRHLVLDYVAEAFTGERLRCGVKAVSRGRRSIRMRQTLQVVGEYQRPVAHARLVVVAFDVVRRTAIEVPAEVWETVVAFEGGSRGYEHAVQLAGDDSVRLADSRLPAFSRPKAKVQQRSVHPAPGALSTAPLTQARALACVRDHN
jgi:acyl-CoA thioesterase FadM